MHEHNQALNNAEHANPFSFLGMQTNEKGYLQFNVFIPWADDVAVIDRKSGKVVATLERISDQGLFSKTTRRKNTFSYQLQVTSQDSKRVIDDPFSFGCVLGEMDTHLFIEGSHKHLYQKLGAHCIQHQGVAGVSFAVWAPNASHVAVVGDFNDWDGRCHPMRKLLNCGIWEIFIPHQSARHPLQPGCHYKYEIKDADGNLLPLKADPMGLQAQYRPDTSSVVNGEAAFDWADNQWMTSREAMNNRHAPISIYEVHLGSWQRDEHNEFLNYRQIAERLIPYVQDLGFTHIQLMPVSEHPFDGSWGYQPVGLFAPTARFGSPDDFKFFIDQCHQAGLGVLIDWVPGHFPVDDHGLVRFDGTCLYEHEDPRKGFHPDWNTLIYNYGRTEVANFLRASATHWLENYHIDGVRVDAVASMLYLDYSRNEGEWVANQFGGNENLEAVDFLKRFNEELYSDYPGAFSVAEESTSWPGVSKPTDMGGLGFGFKWNMGWMNDTLQYMGRDPIHRKFHHNEISFGLVYAFDENFVLPLSHDEVVHGKGSILARMPGDDWQRFANLRAYYGFMWTHPGKKLMFMGCEFAQQNEWNYQQSLDWHLLEHEPHQGVQRMIRDLNRLYKNTPALHQQDCQHQGFDWIDYQNAEQSIFSYVRYGEEGTNPLLVVVNFTPAVHHEFRVGTPIAAEHKEIFNSDAAIYGGSNVGNPGSVYPTDTPWQGQAQSLSITVPPLSAVVFEILG
ncbi:1,4-alpha-glucan branching protein GlgB [Thalassotalea mangrovi]|uniref:1,4-alpha-glucan branching enzyme GlgB n=1 Tax=Thalassotalea mangrovi TaxID=2572245 RepID=A0A4U1B8M8_9GAMM|nr:1,4-alpha-glucan branching protein GlgB [Thalassotalea mangrovi]TKB46365.1 1,4-alpha-glucan branching protein GlgB [Thalassotalea mangrovi]